MFHCLLLIVAVIAVSILFFLDMDHGPDSPLYQFYGLAHVFFFAAMARALVALPALTTRSFSRQFFAVMAIVFIVGGMIELIQPYFGRSAAWRDVGFNLLGGLFGLFMLAPNRRELDKRTMLPAQLAILAFAGTMFQGPAATLWDMRQAARQFPILGDFDTRLEAGRWSMGEIDRSFARHGHASLRVELEAGGKYAGTTMRRGFGNWEGYAYLAFSVHNPNPEPLRLTLSVRDEKHFRRGGVYADRFNRSFRIEQGWNDIRIPVEDIATAPEERTMRLDRLVEMVFFVVEPRKPIIIHLDYVRLIP